MMYGEADGLHLRCQSMARPHRRALLPPAHARESVAPRLDRRDHPRFPDLVADRTCPSLFHTREQKNGLLERLRPRSLERQMAEQDGADAVEDGAHEEPHGAAWLRLRSAVERQPRLR